MTTEREAGEVRRKLTIYEEKRRNSVEAYCAANYLTTTERCIELEDQLAEARREVEDLRAGRDRWRRDYHECIEQRNAGYKRAESAEAALGNLRDELYRARASVDGFVVQRDDMMRSRDEWRARAERAETAEGPYLLHFEDAERETLTFSGHGARDAALRAFETFRVSWNCRLFGVVRDATGDATSESGEGKG